MVKSKSGTAGHARKVADAKTAAEQEEWDKEERRRQEQANTQEPEKIPDRTVVKITNLQWDRETGTIGQSAAVDMDVTIPPEYGHLTKITCGLEQQITGGNWKAITADVKPCNAKDGKARCELTLPEPLHKADGDAPGKVYYRLTAKHAYSEEAKGPRVEAVPGGSASPFDCVMFYSPIRKEYFVFETEEDYKSILPEIEKMDRLKGKSRHALEATDPTVRRKTQEEIEAEVNELFDGEVIGDAGGAVEELLLIRRNPRWGKTPGWVYIRPHAKKNGTPVKGIWRKDRDATVQKNLEDLLKKAPGSKEHSPLLSADFKLKLFQTDPLKSQKMLWHDKVEKDGKIAGQPFTFSKEGAVCRLLMKWDGADASVDLKEKKFHIGTGGSISFGVLEGKAEGEFPLPEKGVNLLTFLKATLYLAPLIEKGRTCMLRLNVTLSAQAFAGLTISGALNLLDLDLSKEKVSSKKKGGPHASAGGSVDGFAGAQASAGLEVAAEWARKGNDKFEALGSCGVEGGGSAGAGGKAEWEIEYRNGTFHFKGGAGLTVGLGCKGGFSFELGVEEGFKFMGHLMNCMDYHFVVEIKKAAFDAYKNYAFTLMTLGHKALTAEKAVAVDIITNFGDWLSKVGSKLDEIKKAIAESSVATGTLSNVPPEALGQALITIMQTREQDDFRSIMVILNATIRPGANIKTDPSANHKLKWTLRSVSSLLSPDEDRASAEAKKGAAMQAGIKKIEEFGLGIGYLDADGNQQAQDDSFLKKFHALLKEKGVQ
ncbi:MAG: hypothetical protein ABI036_11180 [Fibrobacteria bacterium]